MMPERQTDPDTESSSPDQGDRPSDHYRAHLRPELLVFLQKHVTCRGRALDVGCGEGRFGAGLLAAGFDEVWGVEPDEAAATAAESVLTRVVRASYPAAELAGGTPFDLIAFADSLEHMLDPWGALRSAYASLAPDGAVLVSMPNIGHYTVIRDLVKGRWTYTAEGLLDRSHLRFFTPATTIQALNGAGFTVVSREDVVTTPGRGLRLARPLLRLLSPDVLVVQSLSPRSPNKVTVVMGLRNQLGARSTALVWLKELSFQTLSGYLAAAAQIVRGVVLAGALGPSGVGVLATVAIVLSYAQYCDLGIAPGGEPPDPPFRRARRRGRFLDVACVRGQAGHIRHGRARPARRGGDRHVVRGAAACVSGSPWPRRSSCCQGIAAVQQYVFLARRWFGVAAVTNVTNACASLALGIAAALSFGVRGVFVSQVLALAVTVLVGLLLAGLPRVEQLEGDRFRTLLRVGLPLAVLTFAGYNLVWIDQLMVVLLLQRRDLGLYSLVMYAGSAMYLLPTAVAAVVSPRLIARYGQCIGTGGHRRVDLDAGARIVAGSSCPDRRRVGRGACLHRRAAAGLSERGRTAARIRCGHVLSVSESRRELHLGRH